MCGKIRFLRRIGTVLTFGCSFNCDPIMRTNFLRIGFAIPLFLIGTVALAQEKKEPAELTQARAAMEREAAKAKAAYDAELATVQKLYVARLEKLQKELTMKGNLEGALAVKAAKEGVAVADAPSTPAGSTWTWGQHHVSLRPDGLVVTSDGSWERHGLVTGWRQLAPRVVLFQIVRGRENQLNSIWLIDPSGKQYSGLSFDGALIQGTLVKK
jgi:hypothetical protein